MKYNAQDLIDRLYTHSNDYSQGNTQSLDEICKDCKRAADMLGILHSSKKTQKRARQRLSAKNREKNKSIERLKTMLYNAILCWYDTSIEEYSGTDDEDFIQIVCNEVGIARDEYLKLMEIK